MKHQPVIRTWIFFAGLIGLPSAHAAVTVSWQPVSATGPHTIIGGNIYLPSGGQRVGLEIRIGGWRDQHLRTLQVALDSSGFSLGSPPITHANVPCPSNNPAGNSFCEQTLGFGSKCSLGCPSNSTVGCRCETGFENSMREDYVAFGYSAINAVDISTPNYRYGLTPLTADFFPDRDPSLYLGSLFLDIPPGAQGTFEIRSPYSPPPSSSDTFFTDGSAPILIELLTKARIIIGDPVIPGSRYFTYVPQTIGSSTAVRVSLTSVYHPGLPSAEGEDRDFSAVEGDVRWLGPPAIFPDNAPESSFVASQLQCTPHFMDWGQFTEIKVYGNAIIPSSLYTVREVDGECENTPNDPLCFGPGHVLMTGQWGDAAVPFARSDQGAQPDAADFAAIISGYRGTVTAPPKALTQLQDITPNPANDINFIDVYLAVDAFRGLPFPYPVPAPCP